MLKIKSSLTGKIVKVIGLFETSNIAKEKEGELFSALPLHKLFCFLELVEYRKEEEVYIYTLKKGYTPHYDKFDSVLDHPELKPDKDNRLYINHNCVEYDTISIDCEHGIYILYPANLDEPVRVSLEKEIHILEDCIMFM